MNLADIKIYLVDPNFCTTCHPVIKQFIKEDNSLHVCQQHYTVLKALIEDANSKLSNS